MKKMISVLLLVACLVQTQVMPFGAAKTVEAQKEKNKKAMAKLKAKIKKGLEKEELKYEASKDRVGTLYKLLDSTEKNMEQALSDKGIKTYIVEPVDSYANKDMPDDPRRLRLFLNARQKAFSAVAGRARQLKESNDRSTQQMKAQKVKVGMMKGYGNKTKKSMVAIAEFLSKQLGAVITLLEGQKAADEALEGAVQQTAEMKKEYEAFEKRREEEEMRRRQEEEEQYGDEPDDEEYGASVDEEYGAETADEYAAAPVDDDDEEWGDEDEDDDDEDEDYDDEDDDDEDDDEDDDDWDEEW